MQRTATLTTLAVVAVLIAPAGAATWYSYGSHEPDNALDTTAFMWDLPPEDGPRRIYFNAFATTMTPAAQANGGIVNPNVGVLGTGFDAPGPTYWEAMLGVWVDCNNDGYVGMAETAVREYRNELLLDKERCPATPGPNTRWDGDHNYNNWVTELIPIGNIETTNADKRLYKDEAAMVWGDFSRPDDAASVATCNTNPARGQFQSTGGLLSWIDCQGNRGVVTAINDADAALGLGIGFEDPTHPQDSSSPLNQPTFGEEDTQYSAVNAFDCSEPHIVNSGEELYALGLGEETQGANGQNPLHNITLRPVNGAPVGNTANPTAPATLNATNEAALDNCDTSDDRGADFYGNVETDFQGTGLPKNKANWNFFFKTASRGTLPGTALGSGAAGAPTDFGVELLGSGCTHTGCMQSAWGAESWQRDYLPPTIVSRTDVVGGDISVDIAPAAYFSFYAHVGATTIARGFALPGGTGIYGAAQCGTNTSGIHNNWQCDVDEWYELPDGSHTPEPRPFARPGQRYELRDVDCFDGRVAEAGAGVFPAYYGPAPCQ